MSQQAGTQERAQNSTTRVQASTTSCSGAGNTCRLKNQIGPGTCGQGVTGPDSHALGACAPSDSATISFMRDRVTARGSYFNISAGGAIPAPVSGYAQRRLHQFGRYGADPCASWISRVSEHRCSASSWPGGISQDPRPDMLCWHVLSTLNWYIHLSSQQLWCRPLSPKCVS
jgi:hypothetical protein